MSRWIWYEFVELALLGCRIYWTFNVEYIDDIILYKHMLFSFVMRMLFVGDMKTRKLYEVCILLWSYFNLNWKYFYFEWQKWLKLAKRCQVLLGQTFCWFSEFWIKKRSKNIFTKSYLYSLQQGQKKISLQLVLIKISVQCEQPAVWVFVWIK